MIPESTLMFYQYNEAAPIRMMWDFTEQPTVTKLKTPMYSLTQDWSITFTAACVAEICATAPAKLRLWSI